MCRATKTKLLNLMGIKNTVCDNIVSAMKNMRKGKNILAEFSLTVTALQNVVITFFVAFSGVTTLILIFSVETNL